MTVDFSYVEEVFDSEAEFKHFLEALAQEFDSASVALSKAVKEQDVYTYRKIMHNVGTHLEMLQAHQLNVLLQNLRQQMVGSGMTEVEKTQILQETQQQFEDLLQLIRLKKEQVDSLIR